MPDSRDDFIIAIRYALLKKGAKQKFSLFFLIILSIAIIILGRSSLSIMNSTRAVLNDIVYHVAIVSSSPEKFVKYLTKTTKQHFTTYDQNKFLQEEIIELKKKQLNGIFLKTENEILKNVLHLSNTRSLEEDISILAKVILDKESPYLKSLLINKGKKNGIMKGMSVFSKNFLIGTIIESNYLTSRVLLITDLNSRIPVILENSDINAILSGTGNSNKLVLEYLPDQFKIMPDQIIFTSGKDGYLAAGIPIAESYLNEKNEVAIKALADTDQALIIYITNGQFNK